MTDQDRIQFAEAMHVLAETFGESMTELRTEGYFDALRDFDIQQVNVAVRHALKACRFFPKPVELRELVTGDAEETAQAAWDAVLREIRRVGYVGTPKLEPRALRAVNELWGGWRRLCETLPNEGPELVGWIKQFKTTYASVERSEERLLTSETMHPTVARFVNLERQRIAEGKPQLRMAAQRTEKAK